MKSYESFLRNLGLGHYAYAESKADLDTLKNIAEQAFENANIEPYIDENKCCIQYSIDGSTVFTIFKEFSKEYKEEFNLEF